MGGKEKDHGKCNICGKSLKRSGKRCSGCGQLYYGIRRMNPNEDEAELIRLTKEKRNRLMKIQHDKDVGNRYNGGIKPKFIREVCVNNEKI